MREPTFSERMGLTAPKSLQIDGMDDSLRKSLWNVLLEHRRFLHAEAEYRFDLMILVDFLKEPCDVLHAKQIWEFVRNWYFQPTIQWFRIYELLEFVGNIHFIGRDFPDEDWHSRLSDSLNKTLEDANAGYRYVGQHFVPITNADELAAIDDALHSPSAALNPVSMHIQQALEHLSARTNPDYRNSIKESISAVESLGKIMCKPFGMEGQTLTPLLEKMTKELGLSDHLRAGFSLIYKYTSDANGIRHGAKNENQPEQEDARFMLIACSALVNYIIEKARKQGKLPT